MDDQLHSIAVNRMRGLSRELSVISNNVANLSTTGFQREGVVFSEYVNSLGTGGSISMGDLNGRYVSLDRGAVVQTGRELDLAIEGEGYFLLDAAGRQVWTRAGSFQLSPDGLIVSPSGAAVLDPGGAPIPVPPDAGPLIIGTDGTIASSQGPVGQIGLVRPADGATLRREGDALVSDLPPEPIIEPKLRQGALEQSNVQPVAEMARLIDVTRSYERVQALIEDDDARRRNLLETLGRTE